MSIKPTDLDYLRSLPHSEQNLFLNHVEQSNPAAAAKLRQDLSDEQKWIMTRQECADFFGTAFDTVDLWKRKGMPYEGTAGVTSTYDLRKCATWLAQQKIIKVGNEESEQIDRELQEEKRKIAELRRKELEGKLVDALAYREKTMQVLASIRKGVQDFHRTFGDEQVAYLHRIIDDAQEQMLRDDK